MARHSEVTWQCGHVTRERWQYRDSGPYWEQRGQSEACPECRRAVEHAKAAEAATAQGLPTLKGTPAQIGWAETIRQLALAELEQLTGILPANDPNRSTWDRLSTRLRAANMAGWWIDQRGLGILAIFRRWEKERLEKERVKPVAELLGAQTPPTPARAGFIQPSVPLPQELRPAAVGKPPVAGYNPEQPRHLEIDRERDDEPVRKPLTPKESRRHLAKLAERSHPKKDA